MKIVTNNERPGRVEFFKYILFSFQLLIVGVALPFLFLVGISMGHQQPIPERKVRDNYQPDELMRETIQLPAVRI